MKRLFVIFALVWAFAAMSVMAVPRHRNHLSTTEAAAANNGANAIEAYSDTTSNGAWAADADSVLMDDASSLNDNLDDDSAFETMCHGISSVFSSFALFSSLLALLLGLLFPIVLMIIILRYKTRQRNARMALAEKALASGQPIPTQLYAPGHESSEILWRRGIKNLAVGIGLFLMFWIWDSSVLMGVGILVACYGAGQMAIVRTTEKRAKKQDEQPQDPSVETPEEGEPLDD